MVLNCGPLAGLHGSGQVGLPRLRAAPLSPLPPPALLPFPAGHRSAILEPSSTALLWQHRRAHTGGRGAVFITFPGDYLFKHFSDSYNNKGSVLCFPAEGHLLLKDV